MGLWLTPLIGGRWKDEVEVGLIDEYGKSGGIGEVGGNRIQVLSRDNLWKWLQSEVGYNH